MTTDTATTIDDASLHAAARAAATALDTGDRSEIVSEWTMRTGDRHVVAVFRGSAGGSLHLGLPEEAARRLTGEPAATPAVLGPVLDALGIDTDGIEVDPFRDVDPGEFDDPHGVATLNGSDGTSVLFGLSLDSARPDVQDFRPTAMNAGATDASALFDGSMSMLSDVDMDVSVVLGRTTMPIRELLALRPGMVVEIDRAAGSPIDVLVNGRLIARGEVVVIDDEFGVRLTEIVSAGHHGR